MWLRFFARSFFLTIIKTVLRCILQDEISIRTKNLYVFQSKKTFINYNGRCKASSPYIQLSHLLFKFLLNHSLRVQLLKIACFRSNIQIGIKHLNVVSGSHQPPFFQHYSHCNSAISSTLGYSLGLKFFLYTELLNWRLFCSYERTNNQSLIRVLEYRRHKNCSSNMFLN